MKLNELRIGNWVQIDDLPPEQITLDVFATLKQVPATISKFNPITLTPEILEKCGFYSDDSMNDYRLGDFRIAFHIHDGVVEWRRERLFEYIPPLHQIQNLYFALTGKELTYIQ